MSFRFSVFFEKRTIYLMLLASIAVGLSLSKAMISMGEIGLFLLWFIDGNLRKKIIAFYNNKSALIVSLIYLLTLLGLFYTNNFDYAIGDVRRKIPLLILPLFISSFKVISEREFTLLFKLYVGGVLIATFWSIFVMFGGLDVSVVDKRDLSRFNSHIRFGLEICLAIFGGFIYLIQERKKTKKILWSIVIVWLIAFLFILNLFTGIVVLFLSATIITFLYSLSLSSKPLKVFFGFLVFLGISGGCFIIHSAINDFYACEDVIPLEPLGETSLGERYDHNFANSSNLKENGYFVYKHIAIRELEESWNNRSDINFNSKDLKGQHIMHTLIRFITSKGERKNKQAVSRLTDDEVKAIENGVANYRYMQMDDLSKRLHKIIWEYDRYVKGEYVNGHSVMMRWVYWQTAYRIFKENPILGVGTGDVQDAFNFQYKKDKSTLDKKYRLRAHNQYITYVISFGIVGLVAFLFFLIYPIFKSKMQRNYFYLAFLCIITLSMITEDTLETQVGITFFAFFNTLFLLKTKDSRNIKS